MKIGVIGLGRLGLPMACLLATKHEVWGYDNSDYLTNLLKIGQYKTREPDCDYSTLNLASDMGTLVANTDMALLCVNTPSDQNGGMDLSQVQEATLNLNGALISAGRIDYDLAICSTTMPGTAEQLRNTNQLRAIYSNPVWIAMGNVIADLRRPPMMVIGNTSLGGDASHLLKMWTSVADFEARSIILTDATTAEFIKLAHNAWCTTKMSFMGYIKEFCPTVDIDQVSNFFRNGGERPGVFWRPGPPFSGPCFPRDLDFFNAYTGPNGMPITVATKHENERATWRICLQVPVKSNVLILGRAYKYGTDIEQDSLSFILAEKLSLYRGCEVHVQDELVDGFDPDVCIVTQRELNEIPNALPSNCETIRLWG